MNNFQKSISGFVALSVITLFLPGCELPFLSSKKKSVPVSAKSETVSKPDSMAISADDKSKVLVTVNGTARITQNGLDEKLKQMLGADPMTAQLDLAKIPAIAKQKFLQDWLNIILIRDVWDKESGISESADFKNTLQERVAALEDALIVEKFVESLKGELVVKDSDIKKEYDNNKERYAKVAGGVRVAGAKFEDKESAHAFADGLGELKSISDFQKSSVDNENAKYRDFGRVTKKETRGAPEKLVAAAVSASVYPSTKVVSDDKDSWVMFVQDKVDAEYYSFDEVGPQIKGMLEGKNFNDLLNSRIEKFKKSADIEIDKEYDVPNIEFPQ
jgi:hypothetical protein